MSSMTRVGRAALSRKEKLADSIVPLFNPPATQQAGIGRSAGGHHCPFVELSAHPDYRHRQAPNLSLH